MQQWKKTITKLFHRLKQLDKKSAIKPISTRKIYGIDKDKNIIEITGFEDIFIETADDEGLLLELNKYKEHDGITIRSWPSYPTEGDEPGNVSAVTITPVACNLVELSVKRKF